MPNIVNHANKTPPSHRSAIAGDPGHPMTRGWVGWLSFLVLMSVIGITSCQAALPW